MDTYEIMLGANARIIGGQSITEEYRRNVVTGLLRQARMPTGMEGFPRRIGAKHDPMHPRYFIPDAKHRLITGQMLKTRLLADNHYELEILRILALWGRGDPAVEEMLAGTLARLRRICFGNFCGTGDCVGAGVAALRLVGAVRPVDNEWLDKLLLPLGRLFHEAKGRAAVQGNLPVWYFCLALSELDDETSLRIIRSHREYLEGLLVGSLPGDDPDGSQPIAVRQILLKALSRLPECAGRTELWEGMEEQAWTNAAV